MECPMGQESYIFQIIPTFKEAFRMDLLREKMASLFILMALIRGEILSITKCKGKEFL
jgi:hypothetical protein